jgi:hypothetical protein
LAGLGQSLAMLGQSLFGLGRSLTGLGQFVCVRTKFGRVMTVWLG